MLKKRSVYLLPNIFTTAALFCGFFALVQAINIHLEISAISIFIAMIFDCIDGSIARITRTQSTFGEQYDSLSDMVCFGVAPALIIYECTLKNIGKWGWLAAFIYCSGTALRLARFNTTNIVNNHFFQGLPSPAAAALIIGFVWLSLDNCLPLLTFKMLPWIAFTITVYSGITMITNIPFYSGKTLDVKFRIFFSIISLIILTSTIVISNLPVIIFIIFIFYGLSGYLFWLYRLFTGHFII